MKNTGKVFEKLSHTVFSLLSRNDKYTSVEHDVDLESPDGPRQFDVVIRSKVSGLDLLTVVECRDYNKNLSVTHVDGLHSKANDVNANKAVLVAKKGFSKTAKQKADRLGVTLCTAHDIDRGLDEIGLQVPITFIAVDSIEMNANFMMHLEAGDTLNRNMEAFINETPILEVFEKQYKEGNINSSILNEPQNWKPNISQSDEAYIHDIHGNEIPIQEIDITYTLFGCYFFGHLHDLPKSIGINNLTQNEINIFFEAKDILDDHKDNLLSYQHHKDLPKTAGPSVIIVRNLDIKYSNEKFNLHSIEKVA